MNWQSRSQPTSIYTILYIYIYIYLFILTTQALAAINLP